MTDDMLLTADEKPDMKAVAEEYEEALGHGAIDGRMRDSEDVRLCVWPGQSPDGRKWDRHMADGKKALPWDGASDTKVMLADDIITECVDVLMVAWRRALVGVTGWGRRIWARRRACGSIWSG
jgi:hypothetical protein